MKGVIVGRPGKLKELVLFPTLNIVLFYITHLHALKDTTFISDKAHIHSTE